MEQNHKVCLYYGPMKYRTSDFDYELPVELIAQYPLVARSASRLMVAYPAGQCYQHSKFNQICNFLKPGDLLVLNNTKVIPARLYGTKSTGGRVECLIERILPENRILAHLKASKAPKLYSSILFENAIQATVLAKIDDIYELKINHEVSVIDLLHQYGHVPLPPYIERSPKENDQERYQTIYATNLGAVAAPTAGLHFDHQLLDAIEKMGISITYVTLHVGAGTFQPIRTENLDEHQMHHEWMEISEETCNKIKHCKENGGRVIAVGTTTVRCLETAARQGNLSAYRGETNLFIIPGFRFQCVDGLITNFHLPKSSLLMLVAALTGYEFMKTLYQEAILQRYRFYSYGDAMFITK